MLTLAADRFDEMLVRLLIVRFNRLETTSSSTRWVLRACIAISTVVVVNLDFLSVPIFWTRGICGSDRKMDNIPLRTPVEYCTT